MTAETATAAHPPGAALTWQGALGRGIPLLSGLLKNRMPLSAAERAETLLSLCHLVLFRLQTGNALPLIGILGNADSGKSTLFNSLTETEISLVTPIPHQTLGPILAVPPGFQTAAGHPSLLRPVAGRVDWVPGDTTGATGMPDSAVCVPLPGAEAGSFLLLDLPDVGTVDSRQEHQVTLRLLPWLDRAILMLTEETFAQADHEDIARRLQFLRPERARPELFAVLNRRHAATQDAAFASRLEKVREIWPQASVIRLPHLNQAPRFPPAEVRPLLEEVSVRGNLSLRTCIRNLAGQLAAELQELAQARQREQQRIQNAIRQEIHTAGRFNRAFLSDAFRARLEAFSPWHNSLRRIRALLGKEAARPAAVVDLLAAAPVERHLLRTAQAIRDHLDRRLQRIAEGDTLEERPALAELDEGAIRESAAALVARTNQEARRNVEVLLESLQQRHKLKDPGWSALTLVSSTVLLLDLFIPGVGTIGSVALAALFSALGLGGIFTADFLRKSRSSQVKDTFEAGMRSILEQAVSRFFVAEPSAALPDLSAGSERFRHWSQELPEV